MIQITTHFHKMRLVPDPLYEKNLSPLGMVVDGNEHILYFQPIPGSQAIVSKIRRLVPYVFFDGELSRSNKIESREGEVGNSELIRLFGGLAIRKVKTEVREEVTITHSQPYRRVYPRISLPMALWKIIPRKKILHPIPPKTPKKKK